MSDIPNQPKYNKLFHINQTYLIILSQLWYGLTVVNFYPSRISFLVEKHIHYYIPKHDAFIRPHLHAVNTTFILLQYNMRISFSPSKHILFLPVIFFITTKCVFAIMQPNSGKSSCMYFKKTLQNMCTDSSFGCQKNKNRIL